MAISINSRPCQSCGKSTTNAVLCGRCYRSSPAGKAELRLERLRQQLRPVEGGGLCSECIHWQHRCTLGIPEGGTLLAHLCAVREVDSLLE